MFYFINLLLLVFGSYAFATSYQLIDSERSLEAVCQTMTSKSYIAVDLEFDGHLLCLIQVCWGEEEAEGALIDYLVLDKRRPRGTRHSLGSFCKILENEAITKVFHAPSHDLKILSKLMGKLPTSIVDTQAMYATITPNFQAGYAAVVEDVLKTKVDKTQQCSAWKARPLTSEQLIYASGDVRYLYLLYPLLCVQIENLGRHDFMEEYFIQKYSEGSSVNDLAHNFENYLSVNQFLRVLMSTLKKKAEDLKMAQQMLATKSDFVALLRNKIAPIVTKERDKLLGWEVKFLIDKYHEQPELASNWAMILQNMREQKHPMNL